GGDLLGQDVPRSAASRGGGSDRPDRGGRAQRLHLRRRREPGGVPGACGGWPADRGRVRRGATVLLQLVTPSFGEDDSGFRSRRGGASLHDHEAIIDRWPALRFPPGWTGCGHMRTGGAGWRRCRGGWPSAPPSGDWRFLDEEGMSRRFDTARWLLL